MSSAVNPRCFCENRECNCTPEIIAQVENIMDDSGRGSSVHNRTGWTAEAAAKIVTPLTVGDALDMARAANAHTDEKYICSQCDAVTKTLLALDLAARRQAQEPLINAIAALGLRADEEGDLVARSIAAHAIAEAVGE